jgi:hypothetical protein
VETIFTTQAPDGYANDNVQWELGTKFKASVSGQISAVRIYAAASEGGAHTVRLWNANGTVASGPFTWTFAAGSAGWQIFNFPASVAIAANVDYIVAISTSSDGFYEKATGGFASPINNGH